MFEWNIDDDSVGSKEQPDVAPAASTAALLSASEIKDVSTDLLLRAQRPSFAGKLLRTCIILLLCSFIAALLPQIQVAFGLLGSTASSCVAHAFPGALCLKMAASTSSSTSGAWCVLRRDERCFPCDERCCRYAMPPPAALRVIGTHVCFGLPFPFFSSLFVCRACACVDARALQAGACCSCLQPWRSWGRSCSCSIRGSKCDEPSRRWR